MKPDQNTKQIVWFDYLRVVAAFAVVLTHVSDSVILNTPDYSSFQWFVGNIVDSSVRWCLPMFVMISGFLLLDPKKEYTMASFYESRIRKLLIPIIFWSLFYLLLTMIIGYIENEPVSLYSLATSVFDGKPYYHMWYMYLIPSLLLFTPYIRKIIGSMSNQHIAFLCLILFLFSIISDAADKFVFESSHSVYSVENTLFINWFLLYLGYYIAGYLLGSSSIRIRLPVLCTLFITSIIVTIFGFYFFATRYELDVGCYFYDYLSPNVVVMSLSFFLIMKSLRNKLPSNKLINRLSSYTLGIYLIHPFFIVLLEYAGIKVTDFSSIFSIPLVTILVFIAGTLTIAVIEKIPYLKKVV